MPDAVGPSCSCIAISTRLRIAEPLCGVSSRQVDGRKAKGPPCGRAFHRSFGGQPWRKAALGGAARAGEVPSAPSLRVQHRARLGIARRPPQAHELLVRQGKLRHRPPHVRPLAETRSGPTPGPISCLPLSLRSAAYPRARAREAVSSEGRTGRRRGQFAVSTTFAGRPVGRNYAASRGRRNLRRAHPGGV